MVGQKQETHYKAGWKYYLYLIKFLHLQHIQHDNGSTTEPHNIEM